MQSIKKQEWASLPEQAQEEIYNFFLAIQKRYSKKSSHLADEQLEVQALSNHSANTVSEWHDDIEDEVWK